MYMARRAVKGTQGTGWGSLNDNHHYIPTQNAYTLSYVELIGSIWVWEVFNILPMVERYCKALVSMLII
jgi:hypothetical protein